MNNSWSSPSSASIPCSYPPLLHLDHPPPTGTKRCFQFLFLSVTAVLVLCLLALASWGAGPARFPLIGDIGVEPAGGHVHNLPISRGPATGVSDKSTGSRLFFKPSYPWTNNMLLWQRTSFHFQPEKNWMNGVNPNPYLIVFLLLFMYCFRSMHWPFVVVVVPAAVRI